MRFLPDAVIIVDAGGRIVLVNAQAERTFGYKHKELRGRPISILIPERLRQRHTEGFSRFIVSPHRRRMDHGSRFFAVRKDGNEFPVEISLAPLETRRGTHVVSIIRDVTDRRQAEDSLRESEERFSLAVRGTDAGIWDWDLRSDRVYYSPRWKTMLGYQEHEIANDVHEWERLIHPDDRQRALDTIQAYLKGELAEYELEHRLRHKDGSYRWIVARGAAVYDANHAAYRMVGSHLDITEKKLRNGGAARTGGATAGSTTHPGTLLASMRPRLPGFDIAGLCHPAEFAGGDYFDYLPMADGALGIVIADVSGHGFAPALLMSAVQSHLRALADVHAEADVILQRVNTRLVERNADSQFVTLLFAQVDTVSGMLTYTSAGHPPGYILARSGNLKATLPSTAIVLGVLPDVEFVRREHGVLEPGELLLLLTDGVLEAASPNGILFVRRARLPSCAIIETAPPRKSSTSSTAKSWHSRKAARPATT